MRAFSAITLTVLSPLAWGQWSPVPGIIANGPPMDLYWDDIDGRLYVLEGSSLIVLGIDAVNGVAYYQQGQWYAMGDGITHGNPLALTSYDSAMVIGGTIWEVDSLPNTAHIATWQNEAWQPMLPDQEPPEIIGSVTSLTVLDGELHALGGMDWDMNGSPANGWAIWNGVEWRLGDTAGLLANSWGGSIKQVCDYQGQRYAGGNFNYPGQPNDLARWNGNAWEEVGGGINGDPWVNEMVVYDGKLWVAGEFAASWGNAANGLMTWDGVQWADPFPNIAFTAQCKDLLVANDKLYFTGPFLAQGMPDSYRFGVYDGEQLCVFGGADVVDGGKLTASSDTLYAYCNIYYTDVAGISRWPLNAPMDTCYQIVQGVAQRPAQTHALAVYPNPATDQVTIALPNGPTRFTVLDGLGRTVLGVVPDAFGKSTVDVRSLAGGLYHIEARNAHGALIAHAVFVKEH